MSLASRLETDIASPIGPLRLRRETPADEDFRFALFCTTRPEFALFPEAIRDTLVRQQFRAQTLGHAAQYPGALLAIIEKEGRPIGRIALDETAERLHLIDIVAAPALRGKGAGTAVLRALMEIAPRFTLHVAQTNAGAANLYRRLGFVAIAQDAAYIEMEWRPSVG